MPSGNKPLSESQCWPRSLSPYDVIGPQWVKYSTRRHYSLENYKRLQKLPSETTPICWIIVNKTYIALHWRHNDHDGVSNHRPHGCLLNRLFRRRSKKTSKLRVTGLCVWGIHRDRWIPRTKGQLRRKCFHLMTSLWYSGWRWRYLKCITYIHAHIWNVSRNHFHNRRDSA